MTTIDQKWIRYFQNESESWKRLLDFIQEENCYLKNQLSDFVNQDIDKDMLGKAEEFQNHFIRNDKILAIVRSDISDYSNYLSDHLTPKGRGNNYYEMQNKLRNDIDLLEQSFNWRKREFINYIAEITKFL